MKIIRVIAVSMILAAPVQAQDFDKGSAAAQTGDYATAFREWAPLAEQGNAVAQYNLGLMYAKGEGVPQDYAEAVKWYRLAAEQGHATAQSKLGLMYDKGEGVPQDYAEAMKWYRLAAAQGHASAQGNLGVMYAFGLGVPQDYVTAHMWADIGAANGTTNGAKLRDEFLVPKMTSADISEAQRRARVCMASNYQDCD